MKRVTYILLCALLLSPLTSALYAMGKRPEPGQGKTIKIKNIKETAKEQSAAANVPEAKKMPLPVYLAELSNINDYTLFANSGWDGNWYAGFNVCWMEEFPSPPPGKYSRVFVGAKLGRMKTRPMPGRPVWEKEPIPGDLYISLSSTCSWKSYQRYFLTSSKDIPLEGDPENALENAGESRWFWAEVPLKAVNFSKPNFAALFSPTEYFVSTSSSPALAGGWGSQKINSWMNNDVKGYPPIDPSTALKTPITVFEPAIAMKLIPEGCQQNIGVVISEVKDGRAGTSNKTIIANITGDEIAKAWLEVSPDGKTWEKHGRYVYTPPYIITLKADSLPEGKIKVRFAASDVWENAGFSAPLEIMVTK
jgi:hypothetical protein